MKKNPQICNKRNSPQNSQKKREWWIGGTIDGTKPIITYVIDSCNQNLGSIFFDNPFISKGTPPVISFMESYELHNVRLIRTIWLINW